MAGKKAEDICQPVVRYFDCTANERICLVLHSISNRVLVVRRELYACISDALP